VSDNSYFLLVYDYNPRHDTRKFIVTAKANNKAKGAEPKALLQWKWSLCVTSYFNLLHHLHL